MGIEKDYLMRQLMMLFEVLQLIFRLRKKGERELALEQVRFFYNALEIEKKLDELTIEEMMDLFVMQKKLTNEHLEMIAFVLKEQGELADDDIQKMDYFRKGYFLLEKVERESTTFSLERLMKLEELRQLTGI